MNILSRKLVAASVGAVALGVTMVASATPAAAWHHHRGSWGGWGGWGGPALIGGLALGALAAGAYASPYYSSCFVERRPVVNPWGVVVGYRRVRVC